MAEQTKRMMRLLRRSVDFSTDAAAENAYNTDSRRNGTQTQKQTVRRRK